MIQANQQVVRTVVEEVLSQLGSRGIGHDHKRWSRRPDGDWGVFSKVDDAVDAASTGVPATPAEDKSRTGQGRIACVVQYLHHAV